MPTIAPAKASVKTRIETVARPKPSPSAGTAWQMHEGAAGLSRESPRGSPAGSASSWSHALFWLGALSPLPARTDEGLVRGSVAHDEHGAVGVEYHRVGDAAHECSPYPTQAPASDNDKASP